MKTFSVRWLLVAAAFVLGLLCGLLAARSAGDGGRQPAARPAAPQPASQPAPIGTFFQVFGGTFY